VFAIILRKRGKKGEQKTREGKNPVKRKSLEAWEAIKFVGGTVAGTPVFGGGGPHGGFTVIKKDTKSKVTP